MSFINLNYFALNTCHELSIFRLRIQIWNLITQIRLHRININRKFAQNFDLNTNVFSTHLWRTRASVFCPTFDIAVNSQKKHEKRHFSKQIFFTFLLNSNYLLGFEGIENACNDYCGNWKVSKKNCFMLTARSISIECAIVIKSFSPCVTQRQITALICFCQ